MSVKKKQETNVSRICFEPDFDSIEEEYKKHVKGRDSLVSKQQSIQTHVETKKKECETTDHKKNCWSEKPFMWYSYSMAVKLMRNPPEAKDDVAFYIDRFRKIVKTDKSLLVKLAVRAVVEQCSMLLKVCLEEGLNPNESVINDTMESYNQTFEGKAYPLFFWCKNVECLSMLHMAGANLSQVVDDSGMYLAAFLCYQPHMEDDAMLMFVLKHVDILSRKYIEVIFWRSLMFNYPYNVAKALLALGIDVNAALPSNTLQKELFFAPCQSAINSRGDYLLLLLMNHGLMLNPIMSITLVQVSLVAYACFVNNTAALRILLREGCCFLQHEWNLIISYNPSQDKTLFQYAHEKQVEENPWATLDDFSAPFMTRLLSRSQDDLMQAVVFGNLEAVASFTQKDLITKDMFLEAVRKDDVDMLELLLQHSKCEFEVLVVACSCSSLLVVETLMKHNSKQFVADGEERSVSLTSIVFGNIHARDIRLSACFIRTGRLLLSYGYKATEDEKTVFYLDNSEGYLCDRETEMKNYRSSRLCNIFK